MTRGIGNMNDTISTIFIIILLLIVAAVVTVVEVEVSNDKRALEECLAGGYLDATQLTGIGHNRRFCVGITEGGFLLVPLEDSRGAE
jgi:hypothetical protein